MAKKYENIENIGKMISGGVIAEFNKKVASAEKTTQEILKKLSDLGNAQAAKKLEDELVAQQKKLAEEQERKAQIEAAAEAAKAAAEAEAAKAEAEKKAAEEKKLA